MWSQNCHFNDFYQIYGHWHSHQRTSTSVLLALLHSSTPCRLRPSNRERFTQRRKEEGPFKGRPNGFQTRRALRGGKNGKQEPSAKNKIQRSHTHVCSQSQLRRKPLPLSQQTQRGSEKKAPPPSNFPKQIFHNVGHPCPLTFALPNSAFLQHRKHRCPDINLFHRSRRLFVSRTPLPEALLKEPPDSLHARQTDDTGMQGRPLIPFFHSRHRTNNALKIRQGNSNLTR